MLSLAPVYATWDGGRALALGGIVLQTFPKSERRFILRITGQPCAQAQPG